MVFSTGGWGGVPPPAENLLIPIWKKSPQKTPPKFYSAPTKG